LNEKERLYHGYYRQLDSKTLERKLAQLEIDIARWKREFHKKAPASWYRQAKEIRQVLTERGLTE